MAKEREALGPVVATLNFKGGVGKTTVSANVFRIFWSNFVPVMLVDIDPQFNLTQALLTREQYDGIIDANKTIMAVMEPPPRASLFEIRATESRPPDPDEVSTQLWYKMSDEAYDLRIVPGDFDMVKYSLMDGHPGLQNVQERFLSFIMACRRKARVVVIDCNPSSSFLTLCALHACTHLLVPVRPDRYSILGVELLDQFVDGVPSLEPKPRMKLLLNGVPRQGYDPTIENELRSHPKFGPLVALNRLHKSDILVAKSDYAGFATDKPVPHRQRLEEEIIAIADELADWMGVAT